MSEIDVDTAALEAIAATLDAASTGLEHLGGSAPSALDAGPMTAVIISMLAQVLDSAGNTSAALSSAAELVRTCRTYYDRTDASPSAGLESIHEAMTP